MGIYIEPWADDAEVVIRGCNISEIEGAQIRIAGGVRVELRINRFEDMDVHIVPLSDRAVGPSWDEE